METTDKSETIQLTSNLLFDGAGGLWGLIKDYPYEYREELDDGTVRFTFSKNPILKPSITERADINKEVINITEKIMRDLLDESPRIEEYTAWGEAMKNMREKYCPHCGRQLEGEDE